MLFQLCDNADDVRAIIYKVARVVYAESSVTSLRLVEAMTSMIANNAIQTGRTVSSVVSDENLFDVLQPQSPRHAYLNVDARNSGFQMCLRTALRMANGNLPDCCNGATCFHHSSVLPDWAVARGYIADIDDVLFYL